MSDVLMAFSSYVQLMRDEFGKKILDSCQRLRDTDSFFISSFASVYRAVARGIFILEDFHTMLF